MERIDEIWAPNAFCAEAFRDFFDGPITIVPPCLDVAGPSPALTQMGQRRFGLDPGILHFLFSFDYHSFPERKNPLAVVRAFMAAFPQTERPVGLVVKASSAPHHFPELKKRILAAARADGRITVIDESLSREEMLALLAGTDCYVSLHRSEGFGLGMAEAMMLEKPVIATSYSANAEFITEATGYPVPFTLRPVRPGEYVHVEGQFWAEPDEDACAAAMRQVVDDPDAAASRARAGRAFVVGRYGAANVGRIVAERLAAIRRSRASV
jgi:glycosyltransferase involved in cell wall biosynthesis